MSNTWDSTTKYFLDREEIEVNDRIVLDRPDYASVERALLISVKIEDVDLSSWENFWESLLVEEQQKEDTERE